MQNTDKPRTMSVEEGTAAAVRAFLRADKNLKKAQRTLDRCVRDFRYHRDNIKVILT